MAEFERLTQPKPIKKESSTKHQPMFLTRITVHDCNHNIDSSELFKNVLCTAAKNCTSLNCYPDTMTIICQSPYNAGKDYEEYLRLSKIDTQHVVFELLGCPA